MDLDPKTHTEYSGPVGHEKKLRQTHWNVPEKKIVNNLDTGRVWVKVGPGRWKLVER